MDAVVFDFDGVIADSEPIHLRAFQEVLVSAGLELSREDYYDRYLGFDDHDCFQAVLAANGREAGERQIADMTAAKTKLVQRAFADARAFDGAVDLVRHVAGAGVALGICSGALKEEIVIAAEALGVLDCFDEIVGGKDVSRGKPDPEGYRLAIDRLSASTGRGLDPARSVALEDSPAGIASAKGAGMKVLAVTTSYPRDALGEADVVVASLRGVSLATLEGLLAG
jgi:HAD superfamily hydrolase (TIGR01509 family)